jgi:hypothetical protein
VTDHEYDYEYDTAAFNTEEREPENCVPVTTGSRLAPAKLDNFRREASEASSQLGALAKFVKGKWFVGDDEITNQRRIAHIDQLAKGWIKFRDNRIVEPRRVGKVADGFVMPEREELGDTDPCSWETDAAGNPRDPWVKQYFLPLSDPETGAVTVYVTGSVGGIGAIGALCGVFADNAENGSPIVRLAVSSYKHKKYGRVETPDLQVVGWTGKPTLAAALDEEIPF